MKNLKKRKFMDQSILKNMNFHLRDGRQMHFIACKGKLIQGSADIRYTKDP